MKYRIIIDENREEEVLIYAKSHNSVVEKLEEILKEESTEIYGYGHDGTIAVLAASDILCVTVEDGRVVAFTDKGSFRLRKRLYQIEEILREQFVKINQSCIVRITAIECFETSFAGSLKVKLKNGFTDYVSRRQMRAVKERLGF